MVNHFTYGLKMPDVIWGLVVEHLNLHESKVLLVTHPHFRSIYNECDSWRGLFLRQWNELNHHRQRPGWRPIPPRSADSQHRVSIRPELLQVFQNRHHLFEQCTEAILKHPSCMNLNCTNRYGSRHHVQAYDEHEPVNWVNTTSKNAQPPQEYDTPFTTRFAYTNANLGGDRAVIANCDYGELIPRIIVYSKAQDDASGSKTSPKKSEKYLTIVPGSYFELTIEHTKSRAEMGNPLLNPHSCVAIGLANEKKFPLSNRQPGWDKMSYGYHSDDGLFYSRGDAGQDYGPTFGPGDTVGCGLYDFVGDLSTRGYDRSSDEGQFKLASEEKRIFFTHNGVKLPDVVLSKRRQDPWSPVVGVDSHHLIRMNFGTRPFAYDGYAYMETQTMPLEKLEELQRSFGCLITVGYKPMRKRDRRLNGEGSEDSDLSSHLSDDESNDDDSDFFELSEADLRAMMEEGRRRREIGYHRRRTARR